MKNLNINNIKLIILHTDLLETPDNMHKSVPIALIKLRIIII